MHEVDREAGLLPWPRSPLVNKGEVLETHDTFWGMLLLTYFFLYNLKLLLKDKNLSEIHFIHELTSLQQFSIECCETRTKIITTNVTNVKNASKQSDIERNLRKLRKARENSCVRDT